MFNCTCLPSALPKKARKCGHITTYSCKKECVMKEIENKNAVSDHLTLNWNKDASNAHYLLHLEELEVRNTSSTSGRWYRHFHCLAWNDLRSPTYLKKKGWKIILFQFSSSSTFQFNNISCIIPNQRIQMKKKQGLKLEEKPIKNIFKTH